MRNVSFVKPPFSLLTIVGIALGLMAAASCKPDYPTCEGDKDCKPKEFCVDRKCQQCRANTDCQAGSECQSGKCAPIADYCTSSASCLNGQTCVANRCQACQADGQCPSGLKCMAGRCAKAECKKDDECPQDKDCVKGVCVAAAPKAPSGPPCPLSGVYFGFDDANLSSEATGILATDVECLKKAERPVNVVGRCDARGTDEYNVALSERRSNAVKDHLKRLGIDVNRLRVVPRGALDAHGTDEAGWAKDRRVDLEWQ